MQPKGPRVLFFKRAITDLLEPPEASHLPLGRDQCDTCWNMQNCALGCTAQCKSSATVAPRIHSSHTTIFVSDNVEAANIGSQ